MADFAFESHDHDHCVADTLAKAEAHCSANDLRLTPVRRRTLEILLSDHKALGAYDVLGILAEEGLGKQPPVAYRALDFLMKAGFAHKIEALNAYIACAHLGSCKRPAFLICRKCQSVSEAHTAYEAQNNLNAAAIAAGFRIERAVVEAEGICPNCQDEAA